MNWNVPERRWGACPLSCGGRRAGGLLFFLLGPFLFPGEGLAGPGPAYELKLVPVAQSGEPGDHFDPAWIPFRPAVLEGGQRPTPGSDRRIPLTLASAKESETWCLDPKTLGLSQQSPTSCVGLGKTTAPAVADPGPPQRLIRSWGPDDVRREWLSARFADFYPPSSPGALANDLLPLAPAAGRAIPRPPRNPETADVRVKLLVKGDGSKQVQLSYYPSGPFFPEPPYPQWVYAPDFNLPKVIIACIARQSAAITAPPVTPNISPAILGSRYHENLNCGLLDFAGRWVLPPQFQFLEYRLLLGTSRVGFLLLRDDEPCVVSLEPTFPLACLGQSLQSLYSGGRLLFSSTSPRGPFQANSQRGYLNEKGEWAIPPNFDEASNFSGSIAVVREHGILGVIDQRGQWLTPSPPTDLIAWKWMLERGEGHPGSGTGVIDRHGRLLIPTIFTGLARRNAHTFQIGYDGPVLTLPLPESTPDLPALPTVVEPEIARIADKWIPAGVNGRWGFQDERGRWVIPPRFSEAQKFEEGLAPVQTDDGRWGVLRPDGAWAFPPEFSKIRPFYQGVAISYREVSPSLLRVDGKRIALRDQVILLDDFTSDGLVRAISPYPDYGQGYLDREGNWALGTLLFESVEDFVEAYALVSGVMPPDWQPDTAANIPYVVTDAEWLSPHLLCLHINLHGRNRLGFLDDQGRWMAPAVPGILKTNR